jgi:hypothetical protein
MLLTAALLLACSPARPTQVEDLATDDTSPATESQAEIGEATGTLWPTADDVPPQCDPIDQDCPAGEKCVAYASTGGGWDAHKCVPVMGDQGPGEPCTYGGSIEATDDCDETGSCWDAVNVDGELIGTCRPFCSGSYHDPICPEGRQCAITGGGLAFCIPTCDPVAQDCDPGQACYWAINRFECAFTTEDIPAGEACGYINDCAAGLMCLPGDSLPDCESSNCCIPFCELELGDEPCAIVPGTVCLPFFELDTAPPGYEHVGICVGPSDA